MALYATLIRTVPVQALLTHRDI